MRARVLLLPALAAALALPALTASTGAALPVGGDTAAPANPARALVDRLTPAPASTDTPGTPSTEPTGPTSDPVYLSARLSGADEVPPAGRASAKAAVEIDGTEVTFALEWKNMSAPTMAHVHRGGKGVVGPLVLPFFGSPLPSGATAGAGSVTVDDVALADEIRTRPGDFYVNLHTAELPAGAARGQLRSDPLGFADHDLFGNLPLSADLDGAQEVPGPGDPDGYGYAAVRASGSQLHYAVAWLGLVPSMAHVHEGAAGVAGPVRVPMFGTPVPETLFALAGEVPLDRTVRKALRNGPGGFYVNLHSAEFPAGAVRGQLQDWS